MKPIGAPLSAEHPQLQLDEGRVFHDREQPLDVRLSEECMRRPDRAQPDIEQRVAVGRESLADRHGHADAPPEWTIPIRFPAGSSNRAKWTTPGTSVGGITTFPPAATT